MKKLFVGCRVRILYSLGFPELAGQEGRIVAKNPGLTVQGNEAEWGVEPDSWGSWRAPPWHDKPYTRFSPGSEQLESIQPEGAQPCGMCFEKVMQDLTQLANEVPA